MLLCHLMMMTFQISKMLNLNGDVEYAAIILGVCIILATWLFSATYAKHKPDFDVICKVENACIVEQK